MKKLLQAAVLISMATSAIIAAAISRHSRANTNLPCEWEKKVSISADSFAKLQSIKYSTNIKK